ncbi:hypothetical protein EVA_20625 [gut metagenome]|uniref:Uncharacterized protein n=1 Tax=gut metagenome TaxID=749906 RepID=J9FNT7_9ZZZZ
MQDTLLAISGKPGLYRLVAQGRGNLIVEAIDENKRRQSVGARDRVTSLNDVSMYTEEDDKPLMEIFQAISDKEQGQPVALNYKKASKAELAEFMTSVVPDYDRDRVHDSDIKKLIQWYNILAKGGYKQYVDVAEATEEAKEEA